MRRFILIGCAFLAGCSVSLGTAEWQPGKTVNDRNLDVLVCQREAEQTARTAERETAYTFLGFTLIGLPAAYEWDKATLRDVFKRCMAQRGYTVIIPDDGIPLPKS